MEIIGNIIEMALVIAFLHRKVAN